MSHHPTPPLHLKSSSTISALYHFLSLPVYHLVFHTHRHLSSLYLPFRALLTSVCLAPWCPVSLSFTISSSPPCYLQLHQAIALPFFGFRWCLCTRKQKTVSSLGSCVCVLPLFFPFFCRRLSPFSYHRPRSVFPFRQLMENKITTIERGAFQDLKELERL